MKLKYYLTIIIFCVTAAFHADEAANARLAHFKLPQYNEKGQLVFILYGRSGHAAGINIFLENALIDMVQSTISDIDLVRDFSGLELYPIDASQNDVFSFWNDKPHCAALIAASRATFDRAAQTVKGDNEIFFRSPAIDIDGEGFDGELAGRTLHIRKNVRIVIRRLPEDAGAKEKMSSKNGTATLSTSGEENNDKSEK